MLLEVEQIAVLMGLFYNFSFLSVSLCDWIVIWIDPGNKNHSNLVFAVPASAFRCVCVCVCPIRIGCLRMSGNYFFQEETIKIKSIWEEKVISCSPLALSPNLQQELLNLLMRLEK